MEFISGSENNMDKKTFKWKLIQFDEKSLRIEFVFDFPEYISLDATDFMKINFKNNDFIL